MRLRREPEAERVDITAESAALIELANELSRCGDPMAAEGLRAGLNVGIEVFNAKVTLRAALLTSRHARALAFGTWMLAVATVVLVYATWVKS